MKRRLKITFARGRCSGSLASFSIVSSLALDRNLADLRLWQRLSGYFSLRCRCGRRGSASSTAMSAVRRRFVLLDSGLQFVVSTEGLDLPSDTEIVIPLYGLLKSTDGFPDADRFERVTGQAIEH
jgi:hypothetical protein